MLQLALSCRARGKHGHSNCYWLAIVNFDFRSCRKGSLFHKLARMYRQRVKSSASRSPCGCMHGLDASMSFALW